MRRRVAAVGAVAALAVLAGCGAFGPGSVSQADLDETATYSPYWDRPTDVTIVVDRTAYRAIYRFENRSSIELFGFRRFNNRQALLPKAVRYRYANGTVTTLTADRFETARGHTTVRLPATDGALAFTGPKSGKRLRVGIFDEEASYEVLLPERGQVGLPLLGRVIPGGYNRSTFDGRTRLVWEDPQGDRIVVRYYLGRDLLLFGGLVMGGLIVGTIGGLYLWLQLRRVRERRRTAGIDEEP